MQKTIHILCKRCVFIRVIILKSTLWYFCRAVIPACPSIFYNISKRNKITHHFLWQPSKQLQNVQKKTEKKETTRIKRSIGTELIREFKSNSTICHVLCCVQVTSLSRTPYILQNTTRRFSCSWKHLFEGHSITHQLVWILLTSSLFILLAF